jgi:hypothetical protein
MAFTFVANVFAQAGATVGEIVMGLTVRPIDLASVELGGRPLIGDNRMRTRTLWEVVQVDAFNPLYRHWAPEMVESLTDPLNAWILGCTQSKL